MRYFDPIPEQYQPSFSKGSIIIYDTKDKMMHQLIFTAIETLEFEGWNVKRNDPNSEGLGWIAVEIDDRNEYEKLQSDFLDAMKEAERQLDIR